MDNNDISVLLGRRAEQQTFEGNDRRSRQEDGRRLEDCIGDGYLLERFNTINTLGRRGALMDRAGRVDLSALQSDTFFLTPTLGEAASRGDGVGTCNYKIGVNFMLNEGRLVGITPNVLQGSMGENCLDVIKNFTDLGIKIQLPYYEVADYLKENADSSKLCVHILNLLRSLRAIPRDETFRAFETTLYILGRWHKSDPDLFIVDGRLRMLTSQKNNPIQFRSAGAIGLFNLKERTLVKAGFWNDAPVEENGVERIDCLSDYMREAVTEAIINTTMGRGQNSTSTALMALRSYECMDPFLWRLFFETFAVAPARIEGAAICQRRGGDIDDLRSALKGLFAGSCLPRMAHSA